MPSRLLKAGRDSYLYWENGRRAVVYAETQIGGECDVVIYESSLVRWISPHHHEFILQDERERLLDCLARDLTRSNAHWRIEDDRVNVEQQRVQVLAWREAPEAAPLHVCDEAQWELSFVRKLLWAACAMAALIAFYVGLSCGSMLLGAGFFGGLVAWPLLAWLPFFVRRTARRQHL
jgi:hypothetical protein